jgi:hypothetical protein
MVAQLQLDWLQNGCGCAYQPDTALSTSKHDQKHTKNTNYRENDIELKRVYHRIQGDTELRVVSEQASMMACWGDVHLEQRSCATPIAQITLSN